MIQFPDMFPGTNLNDVNLDWILEAIRNLDERVTALEEENDNELP